MVHPHAGPQEMTVSCNAADVIPAPLRSTPIGWQAPVKCLHPHTHTPVGLPDRAVALEAAAKAQLPDPVAC
jgi:hypothetical protein